MAIKNFCYCIGGVGSKIAEVAGHLCAMNMINDNDITFIVVDKDNDCGGTDKATKLLETVTSLSDVERNPDTALVRSRDNQKEFCKSRMNKYSWNFSESMERITSGNQNASLKEALVSSNYALKTSDEMLLDAFYSQTEQEQKTTGGFYGHPSIGALIFKYMVKSSNWIPTRNDNFTLHEGDIAYPIRQHLTKNDNEAKVFIIGSIFGGTGASIFSNLAHYIRSSLNDSERERVLISGALMLPYFTFPKGEKIDPDAFTQKSIVALKQYGNDVNLIRNDKKSCASFDSIYVCGQNPLHCIAENYCDSGELQINHFDLVDLFAAQAMIEFFNADFNDFNDTAINAPGAKRGFYEYRFSSNGDQNNNINRVSLTHTVGIDRSLKAMTAFCTFFITKIYASIMHDKPAHSAVLKNLLTHDEMKEYDNQYKEAVKKITIAVYGYCCSFIDFMYDISRNGYDYSKTATSYANDYSLFNKDYFKKLSDITYLFKKDPDAVKRAIKMCNEINSIKRNENVDYVLDAPGITCKEIQKVLDEMFDKKNMNKVYRDTKTDVNKRIGDYIHSTFKVCFDLAEGGKK